MKAALYVRVSTEEQAEEGFSISAQINQLTEYCKRQNIEIYNAYVDEGVSAKYSDEKKRPQFEQMLKDAEKKLFNIIVVHKYDRFARNVELSQKVKRQLKKSSVQVISMSEPIEDSPIGFFQEGILELLAEYYIRNLAQESKKGHVERASQGLHNGSVPYGYKVDHSIESQMSVNQEQAKIIRLIYDMYINQGYGSTKISRILNETGIPSSTGGQWVHYQVNHILQNPKYIGKISYDGNIYDGKHEAIIDEQTFELAQRFRKERTWPREYRGANFSKFLFLGILRCGECGKVFRVQNSERCRPDRPTSKFYYTCNSANHYDTIYKCDFKKYFNVVKTEDILLSELKNIMDGFIDDVIIEKHTPEIDIVSERKTILKNKLDRSKQAYLSGIFTLKEYIEERTKLEKELSEIKSTPVEKKNDIKLLRKKMKNCFERFKKTESIPEKKAILKEFIKEIKIYKNKTEIIFFL